ncbi:MAG TPA: selenocysteine-specific translation elongation factor [Burkholderiales bacterium]|nr:selenocysteine-specific translation elongation factor [Burkholderiales bacterium]
MIIGTAGHIDHGKTTLVKALTGVDTDRLKEEKARGISIELGYAYLPLESGDVLGFVDVPGHERFIHHMLAGATGIDFALLVVAADDGVMPQTLEHLEILSLLGIARGVVALTKIDRAGPERSEEVAGAVAALIARMPLAGAPVFKVSAVTGEGIGTLLGHLRSQAAAFTRRAAQGLFRLAVDRCFTLAGAGTVVTGTVFAGGVRVGEELLVSPSGREVRVRSIHAQNRAAREARAGDRCALNLAGVAKDEVERGEWIVSPALHAPSPRIDARVRLLPGVSRGLRHWAPVHVHMGAAHLTARVALLDADEVPPGGSALAQVVLDEPHCACHGDIFVLRNHAADRTIGGGTVLDPDAPARRRRSKERLAVLAALESSEPSLALEALLAGAPFGVDLARFARSFNLSVDASVPFGEAVRRVKAGGADIGFSQSRWSDLKRKICDGLAAFHAKNADELGPDAGRARRMWLPQLPPAACAAVVDELVGEAKVRRSGPWLHLPTHSVSLSKAEQQLAERLLPLVEEGRFDPLWVRDLARKAASTEVQVRQLLLRLTRRGEVYQVVKDLFYSKRAVAELAALAAELERADGEVRAAGFRDRTGLGRKRAIQILEFFDRVGYTRRVNEAHRLRGDNLLQIAPRAPAQPQAGTGR